MPIRLGLLGLSFAVALVIAAPVNAQERPAASADRSAQEARTQRQDRARVHQPGQRANAGQRAENRQGRDGARGNQGSQGARGARGSRGNQGSQGVRGSRGGQVRDNAAASRVRGTTRTRSRQHRTAP